MIDDDAREETNAVVDNQSKNRFELVRNGETAFLVYERTNEALALIHTEVPMPLRGLHLGDALVEAALQSARTAGLRIIAVCPFVRAYMRKHSIAVPTADTTETAPG